jgi:hypothetical protein
MPIRRQLASGRRRQPAIALLAILTVLLTSACSEKPPTSPNARYTLSGRVRLVGHLVDAGGNFAGTRIVDDASGVAVELTYGPTVLARTTTVHGVYRFPGLGPGAYRTRATVIGATADETPNITIAGTDVEAGYLLTLSSLGDLLPIPNPHVDSVLVWFDNPTDQFVDIRIRDLGGNTTRVLISEVVQAGLKVALWNGRDGTGAPANGSLYWVTFESGADQRAHLLFH